MREVCNPYPPSYIADLIAAVETVGEQLDENVWGLETEMIHHVKDNIFTIRM